MKRSSSSSSSGILLTFVVIGALALGAVACSSGSPLADAGFKEVSAGSYTYLDTDSSPFGEGGIKVDLTTGSTGSVNFVVTDQAGTEMADYYKFTPADNMLLRHRYVAAMGQEYDYHFDYSAMQLTKVIDGSSGEDVSESLKSMGRWDSSATETKEQVEKLISYFESTFGMSMAEAVNQ
jgi:hypothetical protein